MKKLNAEQARELRAAVGFVRLAQMVLARAGQSTTPTFYKLTKVRTTLDRRLKRAGFKT